MLMVVAAQLLCWWHKWGFSVSQSGTHCSNLKKAKERVLHKYQMTYRSPMVGLRAHLRAASRPPPSCDSDYLHLWHLLPINPAPSVCIYAHLSFPPVRGYLVLTEPHFSDSNYISTPEWNPRKSVFIRTFKGWLRFWWLIWLKCFKMARIGRYGATYAERFQGWVPWRPATVVRSALTWTALECGCSIG